MSSKRLLRRSAVLAISTGLVLTAAACGGGSGGGGKAGGKVKITVNCEPEKSATVDRKNFEQDVKAFEKANPKIEIVAHDAFPCEDPKTFDAKLAGGQMEDLFYVYYTDVQHVVDVNAAADVSKYIDEAKGYSDIQQSIKSVFDVNGKVYGVPRTNYSMGIIYNKALFKKAGLDPDKAPTTWDEVRADAKKISALGKGYVGYADYSAQNQGGWHFTAEMYANGGSMVSADGKKSTVDSAAGKQVLTNLKKMRWDDNSMGSKQLLTINDVQQMMGSGKLGMYLAAPDNIPIIVKQFKGSYDNLAIGAMPGGQGTLLGGDGYMFNKHDTPAQIKAGMKWLQYEYLTPAKGLNDYQRAAGEKAPVGLPEPNLWVGSTAATDNAAKKKYANVPTENYSQFTNGSAQLTGKLEPPQAQQQYSVLDSVMSAVLTNKNANINQLLSDAQNKINGILAHGS